MNVTQERWTHDKYDEEEQTPKTRDEIIEEYGFDIRLNEASSVSSRSDYLQRQMIASVSTNVA